MTKSRTLTLGEYFSGLEFQTDEQTRLAALAKEGALPARIITRYVARTRLYKTGFMKHERIPGSRPGTALYNEQAFKKIISTLGNPTHLRYKNHWLLYKESAVAFLKHELPQLDQLLTETSLPEETRNTVDAMKAVCSNAEQYGVTADHIITFHEIWGMPRIDDLEVNLPLWLKADETSAQKKQLNRLLAETAELRALTAELKLSAGQQSAAQKTHELDVSRSLERVLSLENTIEVLATKLSELLATSASADTVSGLIERVSNLAEKVRGLEGKVKVPRDSVSANDLHRLVNETKLGIARSSSELDAALTKKMHEGLSNSVAGLDERINALVSEIGRLRDRTGATAVPATTSAGRGAYRSPLVALSARTQGAYRLSSELDFVRSWQLHLTKFNDVTPTFEQALAFHRAFLGSSVVICERTLVLSWISCLSWESFALHMAASPTWSCEEDWAPGAEHLFQRDRSHTPRLLVLHNYDAGLPDCYLAPTLVLWAMHRESFWNAKLFLVPARDDHTPIASVLEHAVCFTNIEHITAQPLTVKQGVRVPQLPHREPPRGADPKLVAQWASSHTHVTHDLTNIQRALKCRVTPALTASFERTTSFIAQYLDESCAVAIAMHHQVIPWIRATYGDAKARELTSIVETLTGSVQS